MLSRSLSLAFGLLLGAAPAAAQRSLTIYNDGRVLMRAMLPARVTAGISSHRLALGFLTPGSLFSLDPEVDIVGASYDAAVDERNTLRRAVGRRLVFETGYRVNNEPVTIEVEVLGVEPEMFRMPDGTISFQRPGRPRYPADLILVAPTVDVNLRSGGARDALRLGWFTDGAGWTANYSVVLGRGSARVSGQAEIQPGRLWVDDAEVQLLAGNVGRAAAVGGVLQRRMDLREMAVAAAPSAAAVEEEIGESHLYSIPGRLTLRPGVATVASLFDPASSPWERVYTVRGQIPWYGPLEQYGDETKVPVEVQYVLKRPARAAGFAELPLPGGTWRLYEPDAAGRPQLVGEASAGHSAPGTDLRLTAGSAFDITADRVQTDYVTQRETRRTIATAGYRVTITNAKDSAVTVDVLEQRRGEWRVLESSVPADRLSSTQARFRVQVPAGGEAVLTYRVRVVW